MKKVIYIYTRIDGIVTIKRLDENGNVIIEGR